MVLESTLSQVVSNIPAKNVKLIKFYIKIVHNHWVSFSVMVLWLVSADQYFDYVQLVHMYWVDYGQKLHTEWLFEHKIKLDQENLPQKLM